MKAVWSQPKRISNLAKHGLDFRDADEVLQSRFCLDVPVVRDYDWLENGYEDE